MTELTKRDEKFLKKLETMKKDIKHLNRQDAVEKINKLIKMIGDGCDDTERSRVMNEAFDSYRDAMLEKTEKLMQKCGINRETTTD